MSVTINERIIQVLLTEIMTKMFKFKCHSYDLRKNNCIEKRIIKSSKFDSDTVSNLGAKLWDILSENIKKAESEAEFWTPLNCPQTI